MGPDFACAKCALPGATIRKMSVTYQTSFDVDARESVHRRLGVDYDLECPHCGHSYTLTAPDPQSGGD